MVKIENYFDCALAAKRLLEKSRNMELDRGENPPKAKFARGKKIITFAPHPDDEIMTGLLPLRLMAEKGWRVIDAAVSLGSNEARRKERAAELRRACSYLGWKLDICGFERVRLSARKEFPKYWGECVERLAAAIRRENPAAVMAPHKRDANLAHMATSQMVRDALKLLGRDYGGFLIETEVWSGMDRPNLLVEAGPRELGWLMTALSRHVKEVERNDYHARMPAAFAENVRRGAEVVGGQGGKAPKFDFGCIYAVKKFDGRAWRNFGAPKFAALDSDIENIFKQ